MAVVRVPFLIEERVALKDARDAQRQVEMVKP